MLRRPRSAALAWLLVQVVAFAGCDGGTDCMPGASSACSCTTGEPGSRVCAADGTFGECRCAGSDAGSGEDAAGIDASGVDAGAVDAGGPEDAGAEDASTDEDASVEPDAGSVEGIVAVAASSRRTCAVHSDGRVLCLGMEHDAIPSCPMPVPMAVDGVSDAVEVATSGGHSCARRRTGQILCWGSGAAGQLGDGRSMGSRSPVTVTGIADARGVAVGDLHSCALRADRSVWCWGANDEGELGRGERGGEPSPAPVRAMGITDAVQVVAEGQQTCARLVAGTVRCWGENLFGQLGNGLEDEGTGTPSAVVGLDDAVDVAAGEYHTCAVRATGRVVCWGDGVAGQLGDGREYGSPIPSEVLALDDAVDVGAFTQHTCAIRASGAVACWGFGEGGQLGNGDVESHDRPVAVAAIAGTPLTIAGGSNHTCVSTSAGELFCWGGGCGASGSAGFEVIPRRVAIP